MEIYRASKCRICGGLHWETIVSESSNINKGISEGEARRILDNSKDDTKTRDCDTCESYSVFDVVGMKIAKDGEHRQ